MNGDMMKYEKLLVAAQALLETENNFISLLANASAFLNEHLSTLNWVGFYLYDKTVLRVGPFQGKVACSIITPPNGVCGTAFAKGETIVVDDVHTFEGHIACDAASQSEIVIPILSQKHGKIGVLDIDSPIKSRFDQELTVFLETFVSLLTKYIDNLESIY